MSGLDEASQEHESETRTPEIADLARSSFAEQVLDHLHRLDSQALGDALDMEICIESRFDFTFEERSIAAETMAKLGGKREVIDNVANYILSLLQTK